MKSPDIKNFILDNSSEKSVHSYDCTKDYISTFWDRPEIGYLSSKRVVKKPETASQKFSDVDTENKILVDINGNFYFFPTQLSSLANEINRSKYILSLKDDWDGSDALSIDYDTYFAAISWMYEYSMKLFNDPKYNVTIQTPEINPTPTGGIHLSWRTSKVRLLMKFSKINEKIILTFYRDHYDNKQSNRGDIPLDILDESFLVWMKNLI